MSDSPNYVVVPRSKCAAYRHLPWSEVVAAAHDGVDGLRVSEVCPSRRPVLMKKSPSEPDAFAPGWDDWALISFYYQGDKSWPKDRTLLYQQNWTAKS